MVEEFRSFYRPDRYDFQPVSIANIVEEVLALQRAQYISRGIIVQHEIAAGLLPVMADSEKLKQVFSICAKMP